MGREDRLKMLFEQDESLLAIDTRLKAVSLLVTDPPKTPNPEEKPETHENDVKKTENESEKQNAKATCEPKQTLVDELVEEMQSQVEEERQKSPSTEKDQVSEEPSDQSHSGSFCPLIAVSRYPYKYIRGELSQQVASAFFDGGKFWKRNWDVYYIHVPPHLGNRPLLLVPAIQVRQFLKQINSTLESSLTLPTDIKGFVIPFHNDGTPHPTFIGKCTSRDMKDELESQIPPLYPALPEDEADQFHEKIEAAIEATRNKKKSSKSHHKQQVRIQTELEWTRCLQRTRCYLGLRVPPELIDERSWDNKDKPTQEGEDGADGSSVDVSKPAPHPVFNEPMFISVDVECNERCHSQITEVGISTLDTLDLVGIPPGERGINWRSRIQSRHFRVREYAHVVNRDFLIGCPDHFEFGKSEWVTEKELAGVVEGCFRPPYSCGLPLSAEDMLDQPEYKHRPRNVVLVGHNPSADVKFLRDLGMTLFEKMEERFIDTIDTAEVFRIQKQEATARSLGNILVALGILGWHLHNAGNDARYTMEAMVGMLF